MANLFEMLFGKPERQQSVSTLTQDQEGLFAQLLQALSGQGAGGAFGESADYFRDLLNPDGQNAGMFEAPMNRQFREEIIPGLSEQFAGMGSGGLSSSSFRNAAVNAGTDLSERLGAMRAGLRQQGAQGLQNLGVQGLSPVKENILRPQTFGLVGDFLSSAAPGVGMGGSMAMANKFLRA